jgi:hypothetical protein
VIFEVFGKFVDGGRFAEVNGGLGMGFFIIF